MSKRAAIYARFSTDLQSDRSIDDQVDVCRTYAERNGLTVELIFSDRALSGSSIVQRRGVQDLLNAARDRSFDVLVAETMSRIGRDEEDRAAIRKRLTFAGITIMTPVDGVVNRLTDGIKAVIDSQYLEDLKVMIRRGLAGVVRSGRHAGGRAYGYRPILGQPGELEIEEAECATVRRIFTEYVTGRSAREIAKGLNRDHVPPPRGRNWNASAIAGSRGRGTGILRNELYRGKLIWNRLRMVRDPDTGRRVSRLNPESDWQRVDVPALAIIDEATFVATAARLDSRGQATARHSRARPRHLFSGLLRCGACGAGLSVAGRDKNGRSRIRCTAAAENGTCPDPKSFYLDVVEEAVLDGLKVELLEPDAVAAYVAGYVEERERLTREKRAQREALESRLAAVDREHERVIDRLARGIGDPQRVGARSRELAAEEKRIRAELAAQPPPDAPLPAIHPATIAEYRQKLDRLRETLADGIMEGQGEAANAIRALIDRVTVSRVGPQPKGREPGGIEVEVTGRLNALLGDRIYPNGRRTMLGGVMVAEEGFEPPTHGL